MMVDEPTMRTSSNAPPVQTVSTILYFCPQFSDGSVGRPTAFLLPILFRNLSMEDKKICLLPLVSSFSFYAVKTLGVYAGSLNNGLVEMYFRIT